jgi:hypothetical protein
VVWKKRGLGLEDGQGKKKTKKNQNKWIVLPLIRGMISGDKPLQGVLQRLHLTKYHPFFLF